MSNTWVKLSQAVSATKDSTSNVIFHIDTRDRHTMIEATEDSVPEEFTYPINTVLEVLYDKEWTWWKNMRCKYVKIHIDPIKKVCIIKDRYGSDIILEQLKKQ